MKCYLTIINNEHITGEKELEGIAALRELKNVFECYWKYNTGYSDHFKKVKIHYDLNGSDITAKIILKDNGMGFNYEYHYFFEGAQNL